MTNKYQEALNEIENGGSYEDLKGAITDMQELIYKYESLEKQNKLLETENDALFKVNIRLKKELKNAR